MRDLNECLGEQTVESGAVQRSKSQGNADINAYILMFLTNSALNEPSSRG